MTKSTCWGLEDCFQGRFQGQVERQIEARVEGKVRASLFAASLVFFFACLLVPTFGQTANSSAVTPVSTAAQSAPPAEQPKFELVDVYASSTTPGFVQTFGGVIRDGLYIYRDATVLNLIESAYDVPEDTISGGPGWVGYDLFDVVAKVPADTTQANANLMLKSLLADRFALVVKQGTAPVPRYVLTVGKGGSKLTPASGSDPMGCKPIQQQAAAAPPPGTPPDPASQPNIKLACHNFTSADLADQLHQMAGGYLDHDVIDQTKLEGAWDFDIEWTGRGLLAAKGDAGISIFDAVDKQLGLHLELQNVPEPSLVIESVNRKPTANASDVATKLVLAPARFEVASIKPANPDDRPFTGILYSGGLQVRAGGTLREMISMALQIPPNVAADMVVGLPKSAETQRWDITAKLASTGEGAAVMVNGHQTPPPLSVALEMMRGMLIDQFEMKTHTENREVTVYALTVANGKPKMTQAADSERMGCKPDPNAPKPFTNIQVMIACKNTSMAELAQNLQTMANAYIDHPIVDATGLAGGWDFLIGWTPKGMLQNQAPPDPNPAPGAVVEAPTPTGVSVFDAITAELGLKLVKQQRSIPVIVVDHVDEKPIE
jgi:uncharacterized protein (TIGR03435 family)